MNPRLFPSVAMIATCAAFAFSATMEGSDGPNPALNAYSKIVKEAKFPPTPKDALQGHRWLDVKNMRFKLFDDTAKKSDHAKTIRAL